MATPRTAGTAFQEATERRLLGWGLASEPISPGVDIGRDLVLTRGQHGLDLAVVAGVPNLMQALETALTTALGDDVFNTRFGFDGVRMLASGQDPALTRESVKIAVIDVVRRDPRVARIVEVSLDTEPHGSGRRTVTVRCTFESVAGESLGLSVRGVALGA